MISDFDPLVEHSQEIAGGPVVKAPFAFFEEEMEVGFRDAIVVPQVSLGLAPEVLDAVDVVTIAQEGF